MLDTEKHGLLPFEFGEVLPYESRQGLRGYAGDFLHRLSLLFEDSIFVIFGNIVEVVGEELWHANVMEEDLTPLLYR